MQKSLEGLKIAVIHDWCFENRGGEKVLDTILEVLPSCDLYCLFGRPLELLTQKHKINKLHLSSLAKLPYIQKWFQYALPIFPYLIEQFDLSSYDLVISSSHCVAKGVITPPHAKHAVYLHSPMRYAWDQENIYFPKKFWLRSYLLHKLRIWDVTSSQRQDLMIFNSEFVKRRSELYYDKSGIVIHPPFQKNRFQFTSKKQNHVLLFGAWVPYKKMEQTARTLLEHGISVVAAGHGKGLEDLKSTNHPQLKIIDRPSDDDVSKLYQEAKVILIANDEDFGIVALEGLASGCTLVCSDKGGTKEILNFGNGGLIFKSGNNHDMVSTIQSAFEKETSENEVHKILAHFSKEHFQSSFLSALERCLNK